MSDAIGGKPVVWDPPENWEERAKRIARLLRQREDKIRAIGVAGDYADGTLSPSSVLTLVVFFPDYRPDYTFGAVQSMEEMPVALDWVTTAYLIETEPILADDVRSHRLATLQPLVTYDRVVQEVLTAFRDQYFGREERERRIERLLGQASRRMASYEAGGAAVEAVNAFLWGYGPAMCHLVDEPPSRRHLLVRFRNAARVRRLSEAAKDTIAGLRLGEREAESTLAAAERLRDLAELHVREGHAEAIGELLPRWTSELAKGRRSVQVYVSAGEREAAVFAASAVGASIDVQAEAEVPGFHRREGYAEIAAALFGTPDAAALRSAARAVRAASG